MKNQKGLSPVLILGLVVVAGFLLYWIYQFWGAPIILDNFPFPSPVASSSPTQSSVDTKDWKTYINNDLGFSIQYPPDQYSVVVQPLVTNKQNFITLKPSDLFDKKQPLVMTYDISIASVINSKNSFSNLNQLFGNGPLLKYVKEENTDKFPIIQTSLDAEKAARVNGCCGGQSGIESDIFAVHNNKVYEIVVSPKQLTGDPSANKELYEQILLTFKFTK